MIWSSLRGAKWNQTVMKKNSYRMMIWKTSPLTNYNYSCSQAEKVATYFLLNIHSYFLLNIHSCIRCNYKVITVFALNCTMFNCGYVHFGGLIVYEVE